MLELRYELAVEKLHNIADEDLNMQYSDYCRSVASYLLMVTDVYELIRSDKYKSLDLKEKQALNAGLYHELKDEYDKSYLNPSYASDKLGDKIGAVLSSVYAECQACVSYAYRQDIEDLLIRMELFIQIYVILTSEDDGIDTLTAVKDAIGSFSYDYLELFTERQLSDRYIYKPTLAGEIIEKADLTSIDYLYDYGDYISDNECKLVRFMNTLSDEEIDRMASVYTEGYRLGFIVTGKDLSIKDTVEIRYFIGFERMVRRAVELFASIGLKSVICPAEVSVYNGRKSVKNGLYGTIPNRQFEYDHENDKALFFDKRYMERRIEALHKALESQKSELALFGGPAVIESFGESPFIPESKSVVIKPDEKTRKLFNEYTSRSVTMLGDYIKNEERSFTIIAFPIPDIGDRFEEIFRETIGINTLDYEMYRDMQQIIIDQLDKAEKVHIRGKDGNLTDLTVALITLNDPEKETAFENCVADVNIPVGEVFTSPRLEGTDGLLHVKYVYLNGRPYKNLKLWFVNGCVKDYSCDNYEEESKNREYIREHLLFNHETLPMGEFAIGTNTVAYKATKKYSLENVMPILIAEKTGPHFAVGDTCYSREEDVMTYNPDGKAIVARENSFSALRDTDPEKAYFNCHTDITIPYDELGAVSAIDGSGGVHDIIRDGLFVLEGLESLNEPLRQIV
ncbi:MAG: aminopeptidase [Lachnospiraceae bacterium]|nr:aminopeptidase [Lachnospiraceae bacterium]